MIRLELYKPRSVSGRSLSAALGVLRATPKQVRKYGDFPMLINWGTTERRFTGEYINKPEAVALAVDKTLSLERFKQMGVPCPSYTTEHDQAKQWYEDGRTVVCRTMLRANAGRGIILANQELGVEVRRAPLYTEYVKKADEYRVHVFRGKVLDVAQKKKRRDTPNEEVDYQVRNHDNGWVYCRDGVVAPDDVAIAALSATRALGLDFGAVDVGWNEKKQEACVYEVNTAPGIEGTTLERYRDAFIRLIPELGGGRYKHRRNQEGV